MNYDYGLKDRVKAAARGRWDFAISSLSSCDVDFSKTEGPCPKCQGNTRFRALNDFEDTGALYCSHCFNERNGDGLAALMWLNNWTFVQSLHAVADLFHVSNDSSARNSCHTQPSSTNADEGIAPTSIESPVEADDFEELAKTFRMKFMPYGESDNPAGQLLKKRKLQSFADGKPPITLEGLNAFGAKYGSYLPGTPYSLECIAVPGWLYPTDTRPAGWILRRLDHELFSAYGKCKASKTRLIVGSTDSWSFAGEWDDLAAATEVWVFEGYPDALAAYPHLPAGVVACSNLCGAGSVPENIKWLVNKKVVRFSDADEPGIKGSIKFASKVQPFASSVKLVMVPYEIEPDHGKDVRDFLSENPFSALQELVAQAPEFVKPKKKTKAEENRERLNAFRKDQPPVDPFLDVFLPQGRTDTANSRRLINKHGPNILHCYDWSQWLTWESTHWQPDNSGAMMRHGKAIGDAVWMEVAPNPGDEDAVKFAVRSSGSGGITAMLKLAESAVPVSVQELDANPWLFNCANGTIDLRTGELRPHRREDSLTKICKTNYNPDATSYHFDRFLESIFETQSLIDFVQRFSGYCLTGSVQEQIMAVFYGKGSNGKTTFLEAVQHALGTDYVNSAPSSLLMEKKQETHPTELADLFGRRLVIATETNEGARLAESTVKSLTGGDTIAARRMYENFWTFQPTHKFVLTTNHKPAIRGTDHAIWRRLALVPFSKTFWNPEKGETGPPELMRDNSLPDKLKAEAEGILAWMVRGCLEWQRGGLQIPSEVRAATDEYRSESDTIGRFITNCCITGAGTTREKFSNLYARLESWCDGNGDNLPKKKALGNYLKEHGFIEKSSSGTWYLGINLKQVYEDEEDTSNTTAEMAHMQ